jgi:hypothetical protein
MATAFARDGRLAESLWDMYEAEVRALVDYERAAVGPAYLHSKLSLNGAIRLLSRIAAASLLSGKTTLWIDRDQNAPERALRIGDLVDPSEQESWEDGVTAFEPEVARALKVGPFRHGTSTGEITWSQRPIAEFLAAKYLFDREVPLDQVRQLLLDTGTGRVPPQLHGLAAMLCSKPGSSIPVIELISQRDPHVAIRGDLLNMSEEIRQTVAKRLVRLTMEGELSYGEFHARGLLYRLANSELAESLRSVLLDRSMNEFARELVAEIAEECAVEPVAQNLAEVALDETEDLRVRIASAYALSKYPRSQDRLRLLPALDREDAGDPDHDVRGCALSGLWPGSISLQQMIAALVLPSQMHNYGYYRRFLDDLPETIDDSAVIELLRWARRLSKKRLNRALVELIERTLERGFQLAENASIRKELAPLMLRFIERQTIGVGWTWLRDNTLSFEARFALAYMLRSRAKRDNWIVSTVTTGEQGLLASADFVALLDLAVANPRKRMAAIRIAREIGRLYYFASDDAHVQAVLERKGADAIFDATFAFVWEPWEIRSEAADRAREAYANMKARQRLNEQPVHRKGAAAPRPKCRRLLSAFERGDRAAFWKLLNWLPLDKYGWNHASRTYLEVKELAGWKEEDQDFHRRMINASVRYLVEGRDNPAVWVGKRKFFWPDMAAYRALRLLRSEGKEPDSKTYLRWSVALAAFPASSEDEEHERIVEIAAQVDSARTEASILACLDADAKEIGYVHLGAYARKHLSAPLGDRLLDLAKEWPFETRFRILEEAVRAGSSKAQAAAVKELVEEVDLERAVAVACLIASYSGSSEWDRIRERIEDDEQFARRFIVDLSSKRLHWENGALKHLNLPLREWLFALIEERYPTAEDDHPVGVYSPGPRHRVQSFRSAVLASIYSEGNTESVAAIERLKEKFPELPNIEESFLHARLRMVEENWRWLTPSEVRILLSDPRRGLVRSDVDLQDAVVRSLHSLDVHLRRTGMAWALWDEGEKPRPKAEERFSDFVAEWLRTDLARIAVTPNREVQPRRGERWDILVEVRSATPARSVHAAVVLEVKLATNESELWTGMERQLIGRYMANSGLRHGVYLVGYTYGMKFPEGKRRKPRPQGFSEWRSYWDAEAKRLSEPPITVRSVVIDLSLP